MVTEEENGLEYINPSREEVIIAMPQLHKDRNGKDKNCTVNTLINDIGKKFIMTHKDEVIILFWDSLQRDIDLVCYWFEKNGWANYSQKKYKTTNIKKNEVIIVNGCLIKKLV
jgi:hypothetical protein